jgi:hypothetical protein
MDIGKEKPAIIVEPVRDPFTAPAPAAPTPRREPAEEPAKAPVPG